MYSESRSIRTNSQLRAAAREQLRGNWGMAILVCLLCGIITSLVSAAPIIGMLVSGPLLLGITGYFLKLVRGENPILENLFDGFKYILQAFVLQLLIVIFTFLWSLLFVIPGIIAALRYSQAFYILHDNPGMGAMEALEQSKQMMTGHKGKLFLLYLSFIGWSILCAFTLGIGYLWLVPYIQTSLANFHQDLKGSSF